MDYEATPVSKQRSKIEQMKEQASWHEEQARYYEHCAEKQTIILNQLIKNEDEK
jgi:hypothetical protein